MIIEVTGKIRHTFQCDSADEAVEKFRRLYGPCDISDVVCESEENPETD